MQNTPHTAEYTLFGRVAGCSVGACEAAAHEGFTPAGALHAVPTTSQ